MALSKRKRKTEEPATSHAESTELTTIDGRKALVVGQKEIKWLSGFKVCAGGIGDGCQKLPPHRFRLALVYDDPTRGLKNIKLEKDDAREAYFCRRCKRFMGCMSCVGDIASLVCNNCKDWANDISETVHGRMVTDPDLMAHGFKMLDMVSKGALSIQGFESLWKQSCEAVDSARRAAAKEK